VKNLRGQTKLPLSELPSPPRQPRGLSARNSKPLHQIGAGCFTLFDALNQFSAHRVNLFRRGFEIVNNGCRRQLADLRYPVAMLE